MDPIGAYCCSSSFSHNLQSTMSGHSPNQEDFLPVGYAQRNEFHLSTQMSSSSEESTRSEAFPLTRNTPLCDANQTPVNWVKVLESLREMGATHPTRSVYDTDGNYVSWAVLEEYAATNTVFPLDDTERTAKAEHSESCL